MSGFQTQAYVRPAFAVAGDFASANPRDTYVAGPMGLVAGASPPIAGHFAWVTAQTVDWNNAPATAQSTGFGPVSGFCHRAMLGTYSVMPGAGGVAADSGNQQLTGTGVELFVSGDFWVTNAGSGAVAYGATAYASLADGSVSFASSTVTCATSSVAAASVIAGTASFSGNTMTVSASTGSYIANGATITGTSVPSACKVLSQLSPLLAGEALGGVGRYLLDHTELSIASETIAGTYGILTLGATPSGAFVIGGVLTSSTITGTMHATMLLTGSLGVSGATIATDVSESASSATVTCAANIATKWFALNSAAAGELVIISNHALG